MYYFSFSLRCLFDHIFSLCYFVSHLFLSSSVHLSLIPPFLIFHTFYCSSFTHFSYVYFQHATCWQTLVLVFVSFWVVWTLQLCICLLTVRYVLREVRHGHSKHFLQWSVTFSDPCYSPSLLCATANALLSNQGDVSGSLGVSTLWETVETASSTDIRNLPCEIWESGFAYVTAGSNWMLDVLRCT